MKAIKYTFTLLGLALLIITFFTWRHMASSKW